MAQATAPVFQGDTAEQELAQTVFDLMTHAYGALYAHDALIRQSLSNLASYLAERQGGSPEDLRTRIDAAIKQNPDVFAREEQNGDVIVTTSRAGTPVARQPDLRHTFRQRLYEPERPLAVDELDNIVTTVRQPVPVPEPVLISSYWRTTSNEPAAPVEVPSTPAPQPEAAPAPVPVEVEPVQPAAPAPPTTAIVLGNGTLVDLGLPVEELMAQYGDVLQDEVRAALEDDPLRRIVSFGNHYYPAEGLINYGKNDMRRIRDFIVEQGEPLSDVTILTDLYRRRPNDPDFEVGCFSLDYRLARERDFEFVGMAGAHLWSAKGLPAIGGKRVKASDLGQLFSFLVDGYDDSAENAADNLALHTLTFFEWEYGVLPFDTALQSILPLPMLEDQRTAVVRIESPQHYTSYLCEVRYPTGARGGWLWGLEEFFHEYLVPGVVVSFAPTDDANVFTLSYDEAPAAEAKLLHLDEKRNRFTFVPVTYYAAVDDALLASQARYNKLRNLKVLPMNDRKKVDLVLTHVFETVGEQLGSKEEPLYWITFEELHLAVNVLRPVSQAYLAHLLGSDAAFYADETTIGAWYYKPAPEEVTVDADDEEEDSYLSYDEDDE
ncbi:MAG TPA: hypothetical protein VE268_01130 [Herpetosiphonaceae bacterium]|nr:hypothetical protein [Herpetosiphonaceae bacterium]